MFDDEKSLEIKNIQSEILHNCEYIDLWMIFVIKHLFKDINELM